MCPSIIKEIFFTVYLEHDEKCQYIIFKNSKEKTERKIEKLKKKASFLVAQSYIM